MESIKDFDRLTPTIDLVNGFMQWIRLKESLHGFIERFQSEDSIDSSINEFSQILASTDYCNGFIHSMESKDTMNGINQRNQ